MNSKGIRHESVRHVPVLLEEVLEELHIKKIIGVRHASARYIDATLGAGGYSKAISQAGGNVLGIDTDESMLEIAKNNLRGERVTFAHGNFINIDKIAKENGFNEVDGIVFDLGVSNVHFMDEARGFSFRSGDADLDMRLDPKSQAVKASDLLNGLREDQLKELFGGSLAKRIVETRKVKKFEKVSDLTDLFPPKLDEKINPATKAFMMLRIAVNSELDNLREALPKAFKLLKSGGRLLVVSFHSLEDEIVKDFMREKENEGLGRVVTSKPILPSEEEISRNRKARSAKLRILERI